MIHSSAYYGGSDNSVVTGGSTYRLTDAARWIFLQATGGGVVTVQFPPARHMLLGTFYMITMSISTAGSQQVRFVDAAGTLVQVYDQFGDLRDYVTRTSGYFGTEPAVMAHLIQDPIDATLRLWRVFSFGDPYT